MRTHNRLAAVMWLRHARKAGYVTFVMETSMDDPLPQKAKCTNLDSVDVYSFRTLYLHTVGEATMPVDTRRNWTLCATTIARVFLAAILLLSASATLFQHTVQGELAFVLELLLGAAIAAGWLVQYAATLVLLSVLAASYLAPHFHLASLPPGVWATIPVLIASGILATCGRNSRNVDFVSINEGSNLSTEDPGARAHGPWDENVEVTIRLEKGYLRRLCRHRCIVTIHDRGRGAWKAGQEAGYARDDNYRC